MSDQTPAKAPDPMLEADLTLPDGQTIHFVAACEEPVLDLAASMDAAYAQREFANAAPTEHDQPQPPDISRICGEASSLADPTPDELLLVIVSVIMTPPALTGDGATYTVSLTYTLVSASGRRDPASDWCPAGLPTN